ncbi:MAG: hypothetical protein JKY37_20160 [Nannocystaceae bacterium]|nr:hypothetical protein [Nannocystaceae bacterium]
MVGLCWPHGALAAAPTPDPGPEQEGELQSGDASIDAPIIDAPIDASTESSGVAPHNVDAVAAASEAWAQGDWGKVRGLLEHLADDPDAFDEPHVRTQVLLLIADATLSDTSLELTERRLLASAYLGRQMDADPSWRMPPDIYTKALFDLYIEVSGERSRDETDRCQADLMACRADVKNEQHAYKKLLREHEALEKAHAEQLIEVRDRVARSRIFAAIPFGAGHFYNGDRALGATFLSAEVAFGIAGMSLLLYRVIRDGCRRRRNFQRGSLVCVNDDLDKIQARRKGEEAMGWFFFGTLALDIVLAQIRFQAVETVEVRRVPRRTLEADGPPGGRRARPRPIKKKARATVRPTAGGHRNGASLGVSIQF